jgi:hypothetical protein
MVSLRNGYKTAVADYDDRGLSDMVAIFCQNRALPARDKARQVKVNRLYSVEKPSHLKTNDTGSVFS